MLVSDILEHKYVMLRNEFRGLAYWNENALGYTSELSNAGVFSEKEVRELYGVRVLTFKDIKEKNHHKYPHFALKLEDALRLAK